MTKTARILVVLALGAGLAAAPTPATAQQARVADRSGDAPRAVDVSTMEVRHGRRRIRAVVRIPHLEPGRLSGTELLIRTPARRKVYAVSILRDRRGRVVQKSLGWRPLNDPVEPVRLPCGRIRTGLSAGRTMVSVPTACLTRTRAGRRVRAKVRTVDGTTGLRGAYFDDQTRFTPALARGDAGTAGPAGPAGLVTARGGLSVRSLPTTASRRTGTLRRGTVHRLQCRVSGTLVHRGDDADRASSNQWYRLERGRAWVSALYVRRVHQAPPPCGHGRASRGRVTATHAAFEAPTTRANAHGALYRGSGVAISCRLHGQHRTGGDVWYAVGHGLWVPAAAVSARRTPGWCTD